MRKWMVVVALVGVAGVAQAQQSRIERCGNDRAELLATYAQALAEAQAKVEKPKEAAPKCDGAYGTAISWLLDEKRAADKARAEKKLVMIVHLSGELDDSEKT